MRPQTASTVKRKTSQEPVDTRQRLLDAARFLFWERGYNGASMADILDRACARSGSFYYFFASKDTLLEAVLNDYLAGFEAAVIRPVFATERDPIERIFGILAGYRKRLLETDCTYGCPIGRLALELKPANSPAMALIRANFDCWVNVIQKCLMEAGNRLPSTTDRAALAKLVLTVMEGAVMQARVNRQIDPFDASVSQLREYFRCLQQ
jgi:AcrR family transcriptional regulator